MAVEARLKRLYGPAQPGTSTAVLATVPAGKRWTIRMLVLANVTASPATVTLGVNGTGVEDQIVPALSIAANTPVEKPYLLPLEAGETLDGLQGTSAAITVTVSGIEEDIA